MGEASYIAVKPLSDISQEQARDARAQAWAFVFRCWQERQMAAKRAPTSDGSNEQVKQAKEAAMT
jgi:hypothetical protein